MIDLMDKVHEAYWSEEGTGTEAALKRVVEVVLGHKGGEMNETAHTPLPCPHCGSAPSIHGATDMGYRIICRHNGMISGECSVSDNTEEAAIEAWNRRASDASQSAEIARLRDALEEIETLKVRQIGVPADTEASNEHAMIAQAMASIARAALETRS